MNDNDIQQELLGVTSGTSGMYYGDNQAVAASIFTLAYAMLKGSTLIAKELGVISDSMNKIRLS